MFARGRVDKLHVDTEDYTHVYTLKLNRDIGPHAHTHVYTNTYTHVYTHVYAHVHTHDLGRGVDGYEGGW